MAATGEIEKIQSHDGKVEYRVVVSEKFGAAAETVFASIEQGRVFWLTGTRSLKMNFKEDGFYSMNFGENRNISGNFKKIISNENVAFIWNVDGFRPIPDLGTLVTLTISPQRSGCKFDIIHSGIQTLESAEGKKQGWTSILEDLNRELGPNL